MALESVAYGTGLNLANPPNTDQRKQGDDHLRLIKTAVLQSLQLMGGGFTTGGAATALTVTTGHLNSPTYQDGHLYAFALHTNIGIAATVNFDAIGARTLKKRSAGAWADVAASDFLSGDILLCYYEAGDSTMRIITPAAAAAAAVPYLPLAGGTLSGKLTANAGIEVPSGGLLIGASGTPSYPLHVKGAGTQQQLVESTTAAAIVRQLFTSPSRQFSLGLISATQFALGDETAVISRIVLDFSTGKISFADQINPTAGIDAIHGLSGFSLINSGGNSLVGMDASDYLAYIRASDLFSFTIGGVQKLALSSAALDTTAITINAGNIALQTGASLTAPNGTVIVATNDLVGLRVYTVATLPSAAANPWKLAFASDTAAGSKLVYSDGATWFVSGPGAGGGGGDPPGP